MDKATVMSSTGLLFIEILFRSREISVFTATVLV